MNYAKRALAAICMTVALTGCCNWFLHTNGHYEMYGGTTYQWEIVTSPFCDGHSYVSEIATYFFPFVCLDLPFEVVSDTVTFPFDAWQTWERYRHGRRDSLCCPRKPTAEYYIFKDVDRH